MRLQKPTPKQIYHFTSADSAIQILEGYKFNPSKVTSCNDPFELDHAPAFLDLSNPKMLQYYSNKTAELITNRDEAIVRTMRPTTIDLVHKIPPHDRANFFRQTIAKSLTPDGLYSMGDYDSFLVKQRNRAHVYCFSACDIAAAVVLWSNYADRHRGVAIAFQFAEKEYGQKIYPVNYDQKNMRGAVFSAKEGIELWTKSQDVSIQERLYEKMLLTKHSDWSYEREWRVISFSDDNCPGMIIKGSLVPAIYFGLEISAENRKKLASLITEKYPSCKIYIAQKSRMKIKLEFKLMIQ